MTEAQEKQLELLTNVAFKLGYELGILAAGVEEGRLKEWLLDLGRDAGVLSDRIGMARIFNEELE